MSSEDSKKRIRVVFSGQVQGVGFRYTVNRTAEYFSVSGYVQNLWDGDVELIAEGSPQMLNNFLVAIRDTRPGHNISGEKIEWLTATGEHEQFGIKY